MRITEPVKYRIGAQQRETLASLAATLAEHDSPELSELIAAAIAGDVPAGAVADAVGISYSGLTSWINDAGSDLTAARAAALPQVKRVTAAITLGVATELLPLPGDKLSAGLAVLTRLVTLRDERDEARQVAVVLRGAITLAGKGSSASDETIDSYQITE